MLQAAEVRKKHDRTISEMMLQLLFKHIVFRPCSLGQLYLVVHIHLSEAKYSKFCIIILIGKECLKLETLRIIYI